MKKTDWVYGSVYRTILEFAKQKGSEFSVTELYHRFRPMLAALNCRHLHETGRLVLIRKGQAGRFGKRAIYRAKKGIIHVRIKDLTWWPDGGNIATMQIRLKPKIADALKKEIERIINLPKTARQKMIGGRNPSPTLWVNELVAGVLLNIKGRSEH